MSDELAFSMQEYARRLSATRTLMSEANLDAVVVSQPEHILYLFGYLPTAARFQCCLLPLEASPVMVLRALDSPVYERVSWLNDSVKFADDEDPISILSELIFSTWNRSNVRIGLEFDSNMLTVERYLQLLGHLNCVEFVDFSLRLWELRLRKSEDEIALLRKAGSIADRIVEATYEGLSEGSSERVGAAAGYTEAMRLGADNGRVLLMASGKDASAVHGPLGNRVLECDDQIHLEAVPQVNGYSARIMRPGAVGTGPSFQKDLANRLFEIQESQFSRMTPGAAAREVDLTGRRLLMQLDQIASYPQVTGYTLGCHAQPRTTDTSRVFLPNSDWILEPGMVFHMYLVFAGVGVSETILITESGYDRLTHLRKSVFRVS